MDKYTSAMSILPEISNREKLNCELDLRLSQIWNLMDSVGFEDLTEDQLAILLRMSYASGYQDALTETNSGQLLEDVPGFKISGRKR